MIPSSLQLSTSTSTWPDKERTHSADNWRQAVDREAGIELFPICEHIDKETSESSGDSEMGLVNVKAFSLYRPVA